MFSLTTDVGAVAQGALAVLGEPSVAVVLLEAELGHMGNRPVDRLPLWQRLALGQSPTLMAWEGGEVAEQVALETPSTPSELPTLTLPKPVAVPPEPDDPDDPLELPNSAIGADQVVPRTLVPASPEGYVQAGGVYIDNDSQTWLDGAALAMAPINLDVTQEGPKVLIYHTHATEAYTPDEVNLYLATGDYRTTDNRYNVVRVGEEMATIFASMGIDVIHDTTHHDYPQYNGAYDRSLTTVEDYLRAYPSIQVVLDVHRDALVGEDGTVYKPVAEVDGDMVAQVMLVLGTDATSAHPMWQHNLSFGIQVQNTLQTLWPDMARPLLVRDSRYNQQASPGALLVEVGGHGNTLDEALEAARCFARATGSVLLGVS